MLCPTDPNPVAIGKYSSGNGSDYPFPWTGDKFDSFNCEEATWRHFLRQFSGNILTPKILHT